MNEDINSAIIAYPSKDATVIAKELSTKFGRFIPAGYVVQVLTETQRASNVSQVKTKASDTLNAKLSTMEYVSDELLRSFNDDTLPIRDRIEAVKELRQWTKLGIEMSGIHDEESNTLFVIDSSWSVQAEI